jgi:hypothetical protein
LPKATADVLHGYLFDKEGRLVPFAASTADILKSIGLNTPLGSAFWLDHQSNALWLRTNTSEWESIQEKIASLGSIEPHSTSKHGAKSGK